MHRKKTATVTILAVGVFVLSAVKLSAAASALLNQPFFASVDLSVSLWSLVVFNGLWGVVLLGTAVALWGRQRIAYRLAIVLAPLYAAVSITWQYLFTRGEFERSLLPLHAGITLAVTGLVLFILTRKTTRSALGQIKNPDKETDIV